MLEGPQGLGHDKLLVYFFFLALCIAASLVVRLGWSFRTALISTRNLELTLDRESLGHPQSKRLADLRCLVPYGKFHLSFQSGQFKTLVTATLTRL